MKLFAKHNIGFVTLIFAETIHEAFQKSFTEADSSFPFLSQITREEPIKFNFLVDVDKNVILKQFVRKQIEQIKLLDKKEIIIDEIIVLDLLEKFNPEVWFNFSNSKGKEWCVTTMKNTNFTSFGQALDDYLQTL